MTRNTYDATLTLGSEKVHLTFERDESGAPLIQVGSSEAEANEKGQWDRLVIESLHHGSDELYNHDPLRFSDSRGWDLSGVGQAKMQGGTNAATITSTAAHETFGRGNLLAFSTTTHIIILPKAIYEGDPFAGSPTFKLSPGSDQYTGSAVIFGDRIFAGCLTAAGVSTLVARRNSTGTWTGGGTFEASFLATTGTKLFRIRDQGAALKAFVSWTDETETDTPTWSTEYELPRGGRTIRDCAVIGPHLLIAIGGDETPGQVLAMDEDGLFTPIIPEGLGYIQPLQFVPYLGGQVLLLKGSPKAIWFRSVTDAVMIDMKSSLGNSQHSHVTYPYVAAAPWGDHLYISQKTVAGLVDNLVEVWPHDAGWGTQVIEDSLGAIMAIRIRRIQSGVSSSRLVAELVVGETDTMMYQIDLWEGNQAPNEYTDDTRYFNTGYRQKEYTTKLLSRVRGRLYSPNAHQYNAGGTTPDVTVTVYSENDSIAFTPDWQADGTFSEDIASGADRLLGRSIAVQVDVAGNDNDEMDLICEFPIEVDYFHVPDQKDYVRVPLVAAAEEPRPGGGLAKMSRGDTIQILDDLVKVKDIYTLEWKEGSGRPDWKVIPLSYVVRETDDAPHGARGRSVVWLTLQRV